MRKFNEGDRVQHVLKRGRVGVVTAARKLDGAWVYTVLFRDVAATKTVQAVCAEDELLAVPAED